VNRQATVPIREAITEVVVVGIPYAFSQKKNLSVRPLKTAVCYFSWRYSTKQVQSTLKPFGFGDNHFEVSCSRDVVNMIRNCIGFLRAF
jgi:hypothetical protein